jgi:hypothetical protein
MGTCIFVLSSQLKLHFKAFILGYLYEPYFLLGKISSTRPWTGQEEEDPKANIACYSIIIYVSIEHCQKRPR